MIGTSLGELFEDEMAHAMRRPLVDPEVVDPSNRTEDKNEYDPFSLQMDRTDKSNIPISL